MESFLNTYLPWGIFAVTIVICFYVNIIDAGRQRDSKNPYEHTNSRKLEFNLIIGTVIGAFICYAGLPIPIVWGIAIGSVGGLVFGLLRRKQGK